MGELAVAPDDPDAPDVRVLLGAHLAFARRHSPPEDVHALDVSGLQSPDISFFSLRESRRPAPSTARPASPTARRSASTS